MSLHKQGHYGDSGLPGADGRPGEHGRNGFKGDPADELNPEYLKGNKGYVKLQNKNLFFFSLDFILSIMMSSILNFTCNPTMINILQDSWYYWC